MNQSNELAKKSCMACRGDVSPLKGKELDQFHEQLNNGWKVIDGH